MRFETVFNDGVTVGPQTQTFDKGAIILGVTTGAYQLNFAQSPNGPSQATGRQDTYQLFFQYTDDEKLTSDQNIMNTVTGATANNQARVIGEALMGNGWKNDFPRDLMIPPSQGISVKVVSLQPATDNEDLDVPPLNIHVVFHVLIPRG